MDRINNRTLKTIIVMVALALAVTAVERTPAQTGGSSNSESEVQRGFAIAPVPLNLRAKNPALVGLGSYIVNAKGGCNDCHTCPSFIPGQSPFETEIPGSLDDVAKPGPVNATSYLAGGVPFGPFVSRNITPDATGKPAGFTLEQFMQVIRTGIDLDNEHPGISPLLQVMPWPVYRHMTDRDLRAVYEYLSAIPHANTPPPGTCFFAGQ